MKAKQGESAKSSTCEILHEDQELGKWALDFTHRTRRPQGRESCELGFNLHRYKEILISCNKDSVLPEEAKDKQRCVASWALCCLLVLFFGLFLQ